MLPELRSIKLGVGHSPRFYSGEVAFPYRVREPSGIANLQNGEIVQKSPSPAPPE